MRGLSLTSKALGAAAIITILACGGSGDPPPTYNVTYSFTVTGNARIDSININNPNSINQFDFLISVPASDLPTATGTRTYVTTVSNTRNWIGYKIVGSAPGFITDSIVVKVVSKNTNISGRDGTGIEKTYSGQAAVSDTWTVLE